MGVGVSNLSCKNPFFSINFNELRCLQGYPTAYMVAGVMILFGTAMAATLVRRSDRWTNSRFDGKDVRGDYVNEDKFLKGDAKSANKEGPKGGK